MPNRTCRGDGCFVLCFSRGSMSGSRCCHRHSCFHLSIGPFAADAQGVLQAAILILTAVSVQIQHTLGAVRGPSCKNRMALSIQKTSAMDSDESLVSHGMIMRPVSAVLPSDSISKAGVFKSSVASHHRCEKKEPGPSDLLEPGLYLATTYSHRTCRPTTIGAAAFHFRVRNGTGWFHRALVTRGQCWESFGFRHRVQN